MKALNIISATLILVLLFIPAVFLSDKTLFYTFAKNSVYIVPVITIFLFVNNGHIDKQDIIVILLIFFVTISSLFFSTGGIGSVLNIVTSVLLIEAIGKIKFPQNYIYVIHKLSILIVILLFFKSFYAANDFMNFQDIDINPNIMSYFMFYGFIYWFSFTDFSKYSKKLICIFVCILTFYGIYNFSSRGAMVTLIFFLLLNFLPIKFYTNKYFFISICMVVLVAILIPFIYVYMYNQNINIYILNKSLFTGRATIWILMVNYFVTDPISLLFGLGSKAHLWLGNTLNLHNNFFTILVNFGIFGFCFFYIFILLKLRKVIPYMNNNIIKKLITGFICITFIAGIVEVTIFWTPLMVYAYLGLGISLSHTKKY